MHMGTGERLADSSPETLILKKQELFKLTSPGAA